MARHGIEPLVHYLRKMAQPAEEAGLSDGQLVTRFIESRDQLAFEALVRRHAGIVFSVCRRVTKNRADAEDAFQATFLVLARRAASIVSRETVSSWLFAVAYRTARAARTALRRRQHTEERVKEMRRQSTIPDDSVGQDLHELLDHELSRMPEKYRLPVVLCELEGRSRKEVARHLKIAEGTLSSRLATARKLLARRLAKYGPFSGAAVAAALSEAASGGVPAALLNSTVNMATGVVSVQVATLAQGVIKTMIVMKLRAVAWGLVLAVSLGAGTVGLTTAQSTPDNAAMGLVVKSQPLAGQGQAPAASPLSARQQQVGLAVRVFFDDPLSKSEDLTRKALFEVGMKVEVGKPFERRFGGGEIAVDTDERNGRREVQFVEFGTFLRGTLTSGGNDNLLFDVQFEHSEPGKSKPVRLHAVSTRTIVTLPPGEWYRLECGKTTNGKTIWAQVRLDYMNRTSEQHEQTPPTKLATEADGRLSQSNSRALRRAQEALRAACRRFADGSASIEELTRARELVDIISANADALETRDRQLSNQALESLLEQEAKELQRRPAQSRVKSAKSGGDRNRQRAVANFRDLAWHKLGVRLVAVDASAVNKSHPELHGGMKVVEVSPNGAAARAKIECGDILVGLHNWEMLSEANVLFALSRDDVLGAPLRYYLLRAGQIQRGLLYDCVEKAALESTARQFQVPFLVDRVRGADVSRVRLYESEDGGQTWTQRAECAATDAAFNYSAPHDGAFWLALQTVTRDGKTEPEVRNLRADLKINVTTMPR